MLFFGLSLIVWYVWSRFILERLPKVIPFSLTLLSLILLFSTCFIYLLVLKQLLRPRVSVFVQAIIPLWRKAYMPIDTVDCAIKTNTYVRQIIYKIISKLTFKFVMNPKVISYDGYYIWDISLRFFLLVIFHLDVFYFQNISHFYSLLSLALIPLIIKYLLHVMKYLYETELANMEKWYEVEHLRSPEMGEDERLVSGNGGAERYGEPQTHGATLKYFLVMQSLDEGRQYRYKCAPTPEFLARVLKLEDLDDAYKVTEEDAEKLVKEAKEFYENMPALINLHLLLFGTYGYYDSIRYFSNEIKRMNVFIFSLYLAAWLYILMVSIPTLTVTPRELLYLINFQEKMEPYSGLEL